MKYKDIKRYKVSDLNDIISKGSLIDRSDRIQKIFDFYIPQINELSGRTDEYMVTKDNLKIDFTTNNYTKRAHYLSISIRTHCFRFNLEEQFNNCGILVSTDTCVNIPKKGIGTLLHAIKEDIAYVFGYSAMMYTDRYNEQYKSYNNKIFEDIGLTKLYDIVNKRNSGTIAIWVKNITEKYQEMYKQEELLKEEIKQETLTLEELA